MQNFEIVNHHFTSYGLIGVKIVDIVLIGKVGQILSIIIEGRFRTGQLPCPMDSSLQESMKCVCTVWSCSFAITLGQHYVILSPLIMTCRKLGLSL